MSIEVRGVLTLLQVLNEAVDECARVGLEKRPVCVERTILDSDRDLAVSLVGNRPFD